MAFFILSAVLFAFCVYIGFLGGNTLGGRVVSTKDYWKLNALAVLVAVLLAFIVAQLPLLYSVVIGLLAGVIVGLKMGFGESVGIWCAHDKMFNVNRGQRDVAERGVGEERRRRRKSGEAGPDLISVSGDAAKRDNEARKAR